MTPEPTEVGFSRYFYRGVAFRVVLTIAVMACAYGGAALGEGVGGEWSPLLGAVLGLAVGAVLASQVKRRWDPLDEPKPEEPPH